MGQVLDAKRAAGSDSLDPGEAGIPTEGATIAFYGDGTTSEGDVSESMVFAASFPVSYTHLDVYKRQRCASTRDAAHCQGSAHEQAHKVANRHRAHTDRD